MSLSNCLSSPLDQERAFVAKSLMGLIMSGRDSQAPGSLRAWTLAHLELLAHCKLFENLLGRNLRLLSLNRIKKRQGVEPRWLFEFRDLAWGAEGSPSLQKPARQCSARSHLQNDPPKY